MSTVRLVDTLNTILNLCTQRKKLHNKFAYAVFKLSFKIFDN